MLLKITKTLILGLLLGSSFSLFAQLPVSGFYAKKNSFTLAPSFSYKTYDQFYAGSELQEGNPAGLGEISSSIYSIYAQYGISDRISATLTLPYIQLVSEDGIPGPVVNDTEVDGFQDLGLYIKGKILEKSFENKSKLTLGSAAGITFPLGDYEGAGVLSLGNQATTFNGCGIVQYTFHKVFLEAQLGYSIRTNSDFDIPNAVFYSTKLGYLHKYFYVHSKLEFQGSTSGLDIGTEEFAAAGGALVLPETDVDYTNLSFNLYVPVYKSTFGVSGSYITTLDGRNFSKEKGFGIGLVYNVK